MEAALCGNEALLHCEGTTTRGDTENASTDEMIFESLLLYENKFPSGNHTLPNICSLTKITMSPVSVYSGKGG